MLLSCCEHLVLVLLHTKDVCKLIAGYVGLRKAPGQGCRFLWDYRVYRLYSLLCNMIQRHKNLIAAWRGGSSAAGSCSRPSSVHKSDAGTARIVSPSARCHYCLSLIDTIYLPLEKDSCLCPPEGKTWFSATWWRARRGEQMGEVSSCQGGAIPGRRLGRRDWHPLWTDPGGQQLKSHHQRRVDMEREGWPGLCINRSNRAIIMKWGYLN